MNTDKIRYLLAALDAGTFTAAAQSLAMTQSGLNRQITALEEELKVPLLVRGRSGVRLARGAAGIVARLREIAAAEKRLCQEVAAHRGLLAGDLVIGTYFSASVSWLPQLLRSYESRFPQIRVATFEGTDDQFLARMAEGSLDCAIMPEHGQGLEWFELGEAEVVAWLPPSHPLAARGRLRPEDLRGERFIWPRPGCGTDIDAFFARHGFRPDVHLTTNDPYSAWAMVAAGLGVSLNNSLMCQGLGSGVATRGFEPAETVHLGIAVPDMRSASPATIEFLALARRMMASRDGGGAPAAGSEECP